MPRIRAVTALTAVVAAAALCGGCGLQPNAGSTTATLTVTEQFGAVSLGEFEQRRVASGETALQLLRRHLAAALGPSGRQLVAIAGHAASTGQTTWTLYVNGIQATKRPGDTGVHPGDRVWFDLHPTVAAKAIPATVGAFPEPFIHGTGGKRFPTVLECAAEVGVACRVVASELRRIGLPVAIQVIGGGSGQDSLAITVGTWADLHGVIAADLVDHGPSSSGVFGAFAGDGALRLENAYGGTIRTLRAGAGLIAAVQQPTVSEPVWLVTGTDVAGVTAAARSLNPAALHDHFALAVSGRIRLPLPLAAGQ